MTGVVSDCVDPVVLSCVALRCVVLRSAECCVIRLCCVALCGDLLFVVSCGCVPVALCCIVLQSAVCFLDLLCCCYAYVVFSSLSLRCVFPVVLRFVSCLLSLVFCWFPLS